MSWRRARLPSPNRSSRPHWTISTSLFRRLVRQNGIVRRRGMSDNGIVRYDYSVSIIDTKIGTSGTPEATCRAGYSRAISLWLPCLQIELD